MLMRSFQVPDELWRNLLHDRNGHYDFGLKLALHAPNFDVVGFFTELEKPKVWPQLHGLVLSCVLLVAGIDHRLGIMPSLIGWVLTVWFCWKIASRSFEDPTLGAVAGVAAVSLVATSPALALISTDVMLEGLGSGLSAMSLWAFMAAREKPAETWRWRLLAVALTLLFFEKYNYWALVVASVALTGLLIDARPHLGVGGGTGGAWACIRIVAKPVLHRRHRGALHRGGDRHSRADSFRRLRQSGFPLSSLQHRDRRLRPALLRSGPALARA